MAKLGRMRVAAIVADGFEQSELDGPVQALRGEGVTVDVLAPDAQHHDFVIGVHRFEKAGGVRPDRLIGDADPAAYDALLVPGGLASPDTMRQSREHLEFVQRMVVRDKPIFAICHGPWLLADADVVRGRQLTSWPGIKLDMVRAGAIWVDAEVVVDGKLVTSRMPADIPSFSREALKLLEREYQDLARPRGVEVEPLGARGTAPSHP
jgi:protease I